MLETCSLLSRHRLRQDSSNCRRSLGVCRGMGHSHTRKCKTFVLGPHTVCSHPPMLLLSPPPPAPNTRRVMRCMLTTPLLLLSPPPFSHHTQGDALHAHMPTLLLPLSPVSHTQGDALYAMELALSLEKLNFQKLRELHDVADAAGDAQMCDFVEGALLADQVASVKQVGTGGVVVGWGMQGGMGGWHVKQVGPRGSGVVGFGMQGGKGGWQALCYVHVVSVKEVKAGVEEWKHETSGAVGL